MGDLLRLLLVPVLLVSGVIAYRRHRLGATRASKVTVLAILVLLGLLAASAVVPDVGVHRVFAHGLVIATWVGTFFAIGVVVSRGFQLKKWSAFFDVLLLAAGLGFIMLSAFSGHLSRESPEGMLRFRLLHLIVFPVFAFGLLLIEWLRFRRFVKEAG